MSLTNNSRLLIGICLCGFLISNACDNTETETQETTALTLVVTDSIGVNVGAPEYMFGNIIDVCILSDSTIVLADDQAQKLMLFSNSGEYLQTVSCQGSGPGEYQWLGGITTTDNGFVAHEFYPPMNCHEYGTDGAFIGTVTLDEQSSIYNISVGTSDAFLGWIPYFASESGNMILGMHACLWSNANGERLLELFSKEFVSNDPSSSYEDYVNLDCALAASDSLVFIAPKYEQNMIFVSSPEGDFLDTLHLDSESFLRSEIELELELELRKIRDGNIGDWLPSEESLGVIQLFCQDQERRLWVSYGSMCSTKFVVFDYAGNELFECRVEGLPQGELYYFEISDNGMLAYTIAPENYPRVYLLDLVERPE